MNLLVQYYLRQAGRVSTRDPNGIGPVYASPLYLQRGHGIGSFLGGLFRLERPLHWSGAKSQGKATVKALGREALRTGSRILSDIADKIPDLSTSDIISKHVIASTQNLISKLRGQVANVSEQHPRNVIPTRRSKLPKRLKGTSFLNSHH
jgi:hypothetical protein